jgi:hypothetical protein
MTFKMTALTRKVIPGVLLGALAGALLYFESLLLFPRRLAMVPWLICWALLAILFSAEAKRTASVLTRGFAAIALLFFLLYPTGKVFEMKTARWSGGEVRQPKHKSMSEKALEWIIEDLTSAKASGGLGTLFSLLALLSWARTKASF